MHKPMQPAQLGTGVAVASGWVALPDPALKLAVFPRGTGEERGTCPLVSQPLSQTEPGPLRSPAGVRQEQLWQQWTRERNGRKRRGHATEHGGEEKGRLQRTPKLLLSQHSLKQSYDHTTTPPLDLPNYFKTICCM